MYELRLREENKRLMKIEERQKSIEESLKKRERLLTLDLEWRSNEVMMREMELELKNNHNLIEVAKIKKRIQSGEEQRKILQARLFEE